MSRRTSDTRMFHVFGNAGFIAVAVCGVAFFGSCVPPPIGGVDNNPPEISFRASSIAQDGTAIETAPNPVGIIVLVDETWTFRDADSFDEDGDALTFSWDFGDGSSPSEGTPVTHFYTAVGNYTLKLTVDDGQGQPSSSVEFPSVVSVVECRVPVNCNDEDFCTDNGCNSNQCNYTRIDAFVACNPGGIEAFGPFYQNTPVTLQGGPEECACLWAVNGSGTFAPADSCVTDYLPAIDDTLITLNIECPNEDPQEIDDTFEVECPPDCDDGNACNGEEDCDLSGCVDGTQLQCDDDDDPCTVDSCLAATGCVSTPIEDCCDEDSDCSTGECDLTTNKCVCTNDSDCDALDEQPCIEGICVDDVCISSEDAKEGDPCDDGQPCTDEDECNASGQCVGTFVDDCCVSDVDCPIAESCDLTTNVCIPDCVCGDGTCHEVCEDNECCPGDCPCVTECCSDGDCNDGVFCNGEETCPDGSCDLGSEPCSGDECCNESDDQCDECCSDDDCDDGVFCNGEETCSNGSCETGSDPCSGNDCCDESNEQCNECCDNDDCDDGDGCTDDECDDGECFNTDNHDCNDGTCDSSCGETDSNCCEDCAECCNNGDCEDGDPCTDDVCDDGNCEFPENFDCGDDACDSSCGESASNCCEDCGECCSDSECSDGLYCNGVEDCSNGDCKPGPNPCSSGDYCDEDLNDCCDPNTNPVCGSGQDLGSVSGDVCCDTSSTTYGNSEGWYLVTVTEDDSGSEFLSAEISLESIDSNYDVCVYCEECGGGLAGCSSSSGNLDTVDVGWGDDFGVDDTIDLWIQVIWNSGCGSYELTVYGFNAPNTGGCNPFAPPS